MELDGDDEENPTGRHAESLTSKILQNIPKLQWILHYIGVSERVKMEHTPKLPFE